MGWKEEAARVCEKYYTGSGGTIIICSRGKRKPNCRCGYTGTRLCDWKIGGGRTCDAPICPKCTYEPAEGKDLCPKHAAEWKARTNLPASDDAALDNGGA